MSTDDPAPPRSPTPIPISPRTRTIALILLALLLLYVLYRAPAVLTIAIGGAALALILSYPVRLLSRYMPRGLAIANALLIVLALLIVALVILVPRLIRQLGEFVQALPGIAAELDRHLRNALVRFEDGGLLPRDSDTIIRDLQGGLFDRATVAAESVLTSAVDVATAALGIVVVGFGVLFVAVYLLLDAERLRERAIAAAPPRYRDDVVELWEDAGRSLQRYLVGLVISCSAQGVMAGVALWLLGVPYALLLGVWVGLTAVIPYIGSWLGAIPALILAFLVSPLTGFLTLAIYFTIQTVAGNLITPRVQGQAVQVHPVLVLLAIVAAGALFGLLGVLVAVPLLGIGRVLWDFLRVRMEVRAAA